MLQVYAEDVGGERPGKTEMAMLAGSLFIIAGSYAYSSFSGALSAFAPRCLFRWVTTVPCLFCGMTRSFAATGRLDLRSAFTYHLLGPSLFFCVWVIAAAAAWSLLSGKRMRFRTDARTRKLLGWGLLGLLIVAWMGKLAVFGRNV